MGGKRHCRGGNNKEDKKRRLEAAEKWRATRGDENPNNSEPTVVSNERFDAYYKAQGFVSSEEWTDFIETLKSPLPACFRLNMNYIFIEKLREELMEFVGTKIPSTETSREIEAVMNLNWCPNA